ncbi:MAG TPA: biotin/lipoyl-containing protein, partial [Rhizomicrobium sp.]|nr:biotin/lipoyl-containing protein [Rhizomicrobium sp.]
IEKHQAELLPQESIPPHVIAEAAHFMLAERRQSQNHNDPWDAQDGFRLLGEALERIELLSNGARHAADVIHRRNGLIDVMIAGEKHATRDMDAMRLSSGEIAVMDRGETYLFSLYDPFENADAVGTASDRIVSPVPGKLIQLLVKPGEHVKRGQPLAVLEAMKMEHTLSAQADAVVAETPVTPGEQVSEGAIVLRFES